MKKYNGISYLKLMLTMFVVAHHAFLAFTPSGTASPIHDGNRTIIFSYVTVLFDNFFRVYDPWMIFVYFLWDKNIRSVRIFN